MKQKKIGKLIISATGLRSMADALEKKYKTKGDVKVDTFVENHNDGKTIGILIK